MEELFLLGLALLPFLLFFGAYGAFVEWREKRRGRREIRLKRYPEPRFRGREFGDGMDDFIRW